MVGKKFLKNSIYPVAFCTEIDEISNRGFFEKIDDVYGLVVADPQTTMD